MTVLTFAAAQTRPGQPAPDDLAVAVIGRTAVLRTEGEHGYALPTMAAVGAVSGIALGAMNGRSVWLVSPVALPSIPDGLRRVAWIDVVTAGPEPLAEAVGRGLHLAEWRASRQFCGACGSLAEDVPGLLARRCPACGQFEHIKAQAVALVAIWRRDPGGQAEVLLARHTYGATQFWALVGGYVDPAEGLEAAAVREASEETGLAVTDLRYYGSEGWGIGGPAFLITAFTGRALDPHAEPEVDGHEIAEARFFPVDRLPDNIPPQPLIAARILADLPALLAT